MQKILVVSGSTHPGSTPEAYEKMIQDKLDDLGPGWMIVSATSCASMFKPGTLEREPEVLVVTTILVEKEE